jgi:hypothetical protein
LQLIRLRFAGFRNEFINDVLDCSTLQPIDRSGVSARLLAQFGNSGSWLGIAIDDRADVLDDIAIRGKTRNFAGLGLIEPGEVIPRFRQRIGNSTLRARSRLEFRANVGRQFRQRPLVLFDPVRSRFRIDNAISHRRVAEGQRSRVGGRRNPVRPRRP